MLKVEEVINLCLAVEKASKSNARSALFSTRVVGKLISTFLRPPALIVLLLNLAKVLPYNIAVLLLYKEVRSRPLLTIRVSNYNSKELLTKIVSFIRRIEGSKITVFLE